MKTQATSELIAALRGTSCTCGAQKARGQSLCPCCCDALTRSQQFERIALRHQTRGAHDVGPPTTIVRLAKGRRCLIDTSDRDAIKGALLGIGPQGHIEVWTRVDGSWRGRMLGRVIMRPGPGERVGYINHDVLDNRRRNLRVGGRAMNQGNQRNWTKPKSSRFKGVCLRGGRWRAYIMQRGRQIQLGTFDDEVEAARAYDRAALELFGDHAWINGEGGEEGAPP